MFESKASGSEAQPAVTARPVHGTIGSLEAFDPKTDTVAAYVERAELYMDANDMPDARRVATFLNCVGKTTYSIIRNLMIPDKPAEKSLKDIIAVMEKHFEPKPLVISQRFKFNECMQLPPKMVTEYVAELRKLSEHCKFKAFLEMPSGTISFVSSGARLLRKCYYSRRVSPLPKRSKSHRAWKLQDNLKQMQSPATAGKQVVVDVQQVEQKPCYRCGQSGHEASHAANVVSKDTSKESKQRGRRNFKGKKSVRIVEENLEEPIDNIRAY